MRRPLLSLVLASFVLGACSWLPGGDDPGEASEAQPTPTRQMTLVDLGIDDWPKAQDAPLPAPPEKPEGVSQEEYDRMVEAVERWARQAATDPDALGEGLPDTLVRAIEDAAQAQTVPDLARVTVLDDELEVRDSRMTAAWRVAREDGAVNLSLQTRTAYEVQAPEGRVRVIGVLRTQGVVALPGAEQWGTIMGWQEFGAADCAIALEQHLTPGGDLDDQLPDLTVFAGVGNADDAITPALPDDKQVDDDFAEACRAGRV